AAQVAMTRVKICGITNVEDALAAIDAGVWALGFNFYRGSARYLAPHSARRIIEQLPSSVLSVGVFVNQDSPTSVAQVIDESGVGAAQLHGDESPAFCRALGRYKTIKALRVGRGFMTEQAAKYQTDAILLDAFCEQARGGTGKTFDWAVARRVRGCIPKLILAGGLTVANVEAAVKAVEPYAVDVCSGVEFAPGHKEPNLMRAFVNAAQKKWLESEAAAAQ
ncbi:MAG: phosphoribosylanthranilate isomerase, partial [Acidobacteriota bacterium]|nr:phosphoribosylanthranilate isomerase [Acidobacteriota bacterium]